MITKKYLIKLNKEIGEEGILIKDGDLEFILDYSKNIKIEFKRLAYLVLNIINSYYFMEGNKRLASRIIMDYFKKRNMEVSPTKVSRLCVYIAKNNIRDIQKVKEGIRKCIM